MLAEAEGSKIADAVKRSRSVSALHDTAVPKDARGDLAAVRRALGQPLPRDPAPARLRAAPLIASRNPAPTPADFGDLPAPRLLPSAPARPVRRSPAALAAGALALLAAVALPTILGPVDPPVAVAEAPQAAAAPRTGSEPRLTGFTAIAPTSSPDTRLASPVRLPPSPRPLQPTAPAPEFAAVRASASAAGPAAPLPEPPMPGDGSAPVDLALAAPPRAVPPADPAAPGAGARRVVVHTMAGRSAPAHAPIEAALNAAGIGRIEWRQVPFEVSQSNIRYFNVGDRGLALRAAEAMSDAGRPADPRDFTHYTPAADPGTIELWIGG